MADDETGNSLIHIKNAALTDLASASHRLIRRALSDAMMPMRDLSSSMKTPLRRVGTRDFHDEDFRQLEIWAWEFGMDGQVTEFVNIFDEVIKDFMNEHDGRYPSELFEEDANEWFCDGRIKLFSEFGEGKLSCPQLPKLTHLCWTPKSGPGGYTSNIRELDLSSVPSLTRLFCGGCDLTQLDLSLVPKLTWLNCRYNNLQELDLKSVPILAELNCTFNDLTELDISVCPRLKEAWVDPSVAVKHRDDQVVHRGD